MPGVVGAWSGEELAGEWAGPCRWSGRSPRTSRPPITGPSRRTRRGSRATAWRSSSPSRAGSPTTRPRSSRSSTSSSPPSSISRRGPRMVPPRARRARDQRRGALEPRRRRRPGRVRHRARAAPAPLRGSEDHAEPDRAAWRARLRGARRWASSPCGPRRRSRTSPGSPCRAPPGSPSTKLRIVAPDVGGAFGAKLNVYAEEALCLALARRTGRAVKWIEDRSVSYAVTAQGRGVIHDVEVAATEEGKLLGFRVKELADMGRTSSSSRRGSPSSGAGSTWAPTTRRATGTSSPAS